MKKKSKKIVGDNLDIVIEIWSFDADVLKRVINTESFDWYFETEWKSMDFLDVHYQRLTELFEE